MKPKDAIFVHVGMHKTGSTSIQNSLCGFSDGKTRYGRLAKRNHSLAFMAGLRSGPDATFPRHRLKFYRRDHDAARQAILDDLNSPERNLIFSAEELTSVDRTGLADLRSLLMDHCARVEIIAYVREPFGFASSAFQQGIKMELDRFTVPPPRYRQRFEKFLEIFGAEAMTFIPFDPPQFRDGSIICDFCDRVGIDATGLSQDQKNESLSAEAVALLMQLKPWLAKRDMTPKILARRKWVVAKLRETFPGRFQFSRACIEATLDHDDIAWMEAQAGFTLPAPPDEREGAIGSEDELNARAEAALPRLQELARANGVDKPADTPRKVMRQLLRAMPGVPPQRMARRGKKKPVDRGGV